jgi:cell wall assembly regulator SMI1
MSRILSRDMLGSLEGLLVAQQTDTLDSLAEGASEQRMQALTEPLGVRLPIEARAWWGWHDGSPSWILPGLGLMSIERAIERYQWRRRTAEEFVQHPDTGEELRDVEKIWRRSWLPIFETGGPHVLVLECDLPDRPSPIRQIDWELLPQPNYAAVLAPSLGDYIQRWMDAVHAGRHHYDVDEGRWASAVDAYGDP